LHYPYVCYKIIDRKVDDTMKLHKFNPRIARFKLKLRENSSKYIKVGTLIISVFILIIGILYFAYAKFSTVNKFNVTQTSVGNFNTDYIIASYINGTLSTTIPKKDAGYSVSKITCTKSASATWNYNTWSINIVGATEAETKCRVYFVTGSVYTDGSGASYPELYQGLIPIKYVDGNPTVADITSEWYNYTNHNWANAVLVNCADTSIKNKYFDANMNLLSSAVGTTISMDDILQMYVWVPRYQYLLWNAENGSSNEQAITISFENVTSPKYTGSTNGTWLTHPAFTFGTTELNGIWVGKFENSGSTTNLTIKPNLQSLTNITLGDMFNATRNEELSYSSNYGINQEEIDTHMMKNMEWGAVAYLSSSVYGRYTNSSTCITSGCEIWINNVNTGYGDGTIVDGMPQYGPSITGCSGASVSASIANSMSACATTYSWTGNGVNASTTGNQYGIYDMSGGVQEYVMGNMVDSSGNFYSSSANLTQPNNKYYDSYIYSASSYLDHSRGKLGDATKETLKTFGAVKGGWNNDDAEMVSSTGSWQMRGRSYTRNSSAGIFGFSRGAGDAYSASTFRSVLTAQ
jgi:hypothetical protein